MFFFIAFFINFVDGLLNGAVNSFYQNAASNIPVFMRIFLSIFDFSPLLIVIAIDALVFGYILRTIHNEIKDNSPLLPDWNNNFLDFLKRGLTFSG
ncbi:MAG: hypothetical protein MZV70_11515 [Desulfobacterales bacterium]|nr:hypothetical protein [Desulfobacterales bacterium]